MRYARWTRAGLLALTMLTLLWETVLAPLRPGGSWLALKALPLALLLVGVLRGSDKARQWLALLLPFYLAEALVRAVTEPGRHGLVAGAAFVLTLATFAALLGWARSGNR
jgi:uncharacterized membrane protein